MPRRRPAPSLSPAPSARAPRSPRAPRRRAPSKPSTKVRAPLPRRRPGSAPKAGAHSRIEVFVPISRSARRARRRPEGPPLFLKIGEWRPRWDDYCELCDMDNVSVFKWMFSTILQRKLYPPGVRPGR